MTHLTPLPIKMLDGDYLGHLVDDVEGRKIALGVGDFIESAEPEVLEAVREARKYLSLLAAKCRK